MTEKLGYGKVYNCRIHIAIRKALFLGRDPRNTVMNRNVILTRPYRGDETKAYRFGDDYTAEGTELIINGNIKLLKKTLNEEEYAKQLLEKYGL